VFRIHLILLILALFMATGAVAAPEDRALLFDGFDDYVEWPFAENHDLRDDFTIEVTAFPTAGVSGTLLAKVVWVEDPGAGHESYGVHVDAAGFVHFVTVAGNHDGVSSVPLPTGQWVHIAVRYQAATQTKSILFDGIPVYSESGTGAIGYDGKPLYVGALQTERYGPLHDFYTGRLGEVRLWARYLSQTEIFADLTNDLTGGEIALVGLWTFDELNGAIAFDSTGFGVNGDIHGATRESGVLPLGLELGYPEPNPFCALGGQSTEIIFTIPSAGPTQLTVLDPAGVPCRTLVDGLLAAGTHGVLWDGMTDASETVATARCTFVLECAGSRVERICQVYCGDDLAGPYRQGTLAGDEAIGFAVGLESAQAIQLEILDASGVPVREIVNGIIAAGVSQWAWDLNNFLGQRVASGIYRCRLTGVTYAEVISFSVTAAVPPSPLRITASLTDRFGVVRFGGSDAAHPTVVETPIQSGLLQFDRRVNAVEIQWLLAGLCGGALAPAVLPTIRVAPDSTWILLSRFDPFPRSWADVFGSATLAFEPAWTTPDTAYFHLKHTFSGITATDAECRLIGNFDVEDWACYQGPIGKMAAQSPDSAARNGVDPAPVPVGFVLHPACPNPVAPGEGLTLMYEMPTQAVVTIAVIDVSGNVVRALIDGQLQAGVHQVTWDLQTNDGAPAPEGIYHVVVDFNDGAGACGGDVIISADPNVASLPAGAVNARLLFSARPNPFNPRTTLHFELPAAGFARITLYDLAGRLIATVVEAELDAGSHDIVWDGRDTAGRTVSSGGYLARLEFGGEIQTVRLGLVR
jgi:flagellar hook assembly protein FlgD